MEMHKRALQYLGVTAAIALCAYLFVGAYSEKKPKVRAEVKPREISVVSVLRISEFETVKVLTIPDPLMSDPMFDSRCLVYINQEMRQTQMRCLPGLSGRTGAD